MIPRSPYTPLPDNIDTTWVGGKCGATERTVNGRLPACLSLSLSFLLSIRVSPSLSLCLSLSIRLVLSFSLALAFPPSIYHSLAFVCSILFSLSLSLSLSFSLSLPRTPRNRLDNRMNPSDRKTVFTSTRWYSSESGGDARWVPQIAHEMYSGRSDNDSDDGNAACC